MSQSKTLTWIGWIITVLLALLLIFSGTVKMINPPGMAEEIERLGYPDGVMFYIGIVELVCAILYLIPRTTVLGAVLLTGYLGGAIATHVRIEDPFISPAIVGVCVWLGPYLRDPRLRELLPLRRSI